MSFNSIDSFLWNLHLENSYSIETENMILAQNQVKTELKQYFPKNFPKYVNHSDSRKGFLLNISKSKCYCKEFYFEISELYKNKKTIDMTLYINTIKMSSSISLSVTTSEDLLQGIKNNISQYLSKNFPEIVFERRKTQYLTFCYALSKSTYFIPYELKLMIWEYMF